MSGGVVDVGVAGRAVALFGVTNIDDLLVLAVMFFGVVRRVDARRVVIGQYLGFVGILVAVLVGALGARMLCGSVLPYLGLLPLGSGLRSACAAWRKRQGGWGECEYDVAGRVAVAGPAVLTVAGVTIANGGDNVSVYLPVFAASGAAVRAEYVAVFLVLVAVWCAVGHWLAGRPLAARVLSRWGHNTLPLVLMGVGVTTLVRGGAFGL